MKFTFDRSRAEFLYPQLSDREMDCLEAGIGAGLGGVAIGARLNIEPSTVSTYRQRIFNKLELYSASELTLQLVHDGIIKVYGYLVHTRTPPVRHNDAREASILRETPECETNPGGN